MRRSLTISVVSGLLMLALARRVLRKRRHSCDTAARGIPGCTSDGPCLTPVFVQPAALSDGWSVAPALFYPPSTAVIPFVSPGEASCTPSSPSCTVEQATQDAVFILCEHLPFAAFLPSPNATNEEVVLSSIVKHSLLNAWLNESSVTIMSLDSVEALAELIPTDRASVYSHVALCPKALILIGHNGPFVIAAVVAVEHGPNDVAALLADSVKRGAITSILAATYAVPLQSQGDADDLSSQRLPDTPVGAQGGEFRLRCRHRSTMIVLRMPTGVCVESLPDHDRPTLFTVRVPLADGQQASFSFTSAMFNEVIELHNQSKQVCIRDVLEKHISSGDSPLPSEARVFWNRVVLADLRSFRDEETSGSSGGDAAETGVEVLYTHKHLGISFAVDITLGNSVLYDPLLTESASVLYYPLGVSPARNETTLAPLLSVQRLDRFPSTWSSVTKDDEELIHNVRFHFTNWGSVQTRCTFSDLSGQRCVHFTEECEGHRCRSYIILQNSTLLVIRLESSIAEWDQHWPTFQTIMDTLHLDKVK